MIRPLRLALIACSASLAVNAFVFEPGSTGAPQRWNLVNPQASPGLSTNSVNPNTHAIRFFIAWDGYSTTNTAAELNAVRASFAQWQSVPGTSLKFEDAGLVAPGVGPDPTDDTNVVFWANKGTTTISNQVDIGNALGVTFWSLIGDDFVNAHIIMNGQYAWYTDLNYVPTDNYHYFIESVLLHEIGHFIGLEHAPAGAATMFFRGDSGSTASSGLTSDEVAGARFLYPTTTVLGGLGEIKGQVTMNGSGILGAIVIAEDAAGNAVCGTYSRSDGSYDLPALPPGSYAVRATPLDPPDAFYHLEKGAEIAGTNYSAAVTAFLPATNPPVLLRAGAVQTMNLAVTSSEPAFRITHIRRPTSDENHQIAVNAPISLRVGDQNLVLGVYGPNLPTSGASLTITGDGLTVTPITSSSLFPGLNLISVNVSVSANATPGSRSFIVQQGGNLAFANGFLAIQPEVPDWNFDGLDDHFQRQYWPLFTAPAASPSADPDGDGFNNSYEYWSGTNPTNATSVPTVELAAVSQTTQGTTVIWNSVPGGRYRVLGRTTFSTATPWQQVGANIVTAGFNGQCLDPGATNGIRFYQVQILP